MFCYHFSLIVGGKINRMSSFLEVFKKIECKTKLRKNFHFDIALRVYQHCIIKTSLNSFYEVELKKKNLTNFAKL